MSARICGVRTVMAFGRPVVLAVENRDYNLACQACGTARLGGDCECSDHGVLTARYRHAVHSHAEQCTVMPA